MSTGSVPSDRKKSNVTPVHESGSTNDPGNYHPIPGVPVVAKVFEQLTAIQLGLYFECYNLLHDLQCAFDMEDLLIRFCHMQLMLL